MKFIDINREGSPPRVRGKEFSQKASYFIMGITPACAGKRTRPRRWVQPPRDHPRVCGEKGYHNAKLKGVLGSPPRVQGKGQSGGRGLPGVGITPACAGKSSLMLLWSGPLRDHPRVCGKKFHPASDRKLGRVRGTKRSSGPAPAAAPAGLAGSCPASPPWSYPPRITVSRPRP